MLLVNGKAMLKIGNRYIAPGDEMEVPEGLTKRLQQARRAKEKTAEPKEAKPKAKRGKAGKKNGSKTKNSTGS